MKTFITFIIIILLLVGGIYLYKNRDVMPTPTDTNGETATTTAQTIESRGEVLSVDSSQIALDGPYLISFAAQGGATSTIALPSMGLPLCAAYQSQAIADVGTIQAGQTVSVRGELDEQGRIVPCMEATHYLRVE